MKIPKQEYTTEFKELAVKRVKSGQTIGSAVKGLGLIEQTLYGERFETRDEMMAMAFEYIERYFTIGSGCTRRWATSHRCSS